MNIKMIVTDLDGTLLREDKTVSQRTVSALEECRAKGIKTVYATGRGGTSANIAPVALFDGAVVNNGALAYAGDKLIYSKLIPIENVRNLLVACDNAGFGISAECGGVHYVGVNAIAVWPWLQHFNHKVVDFNKHDIDVEKLYTTTDTPKVLDIIQQHLTNDIHLFESLDGYAMIMHKEATKSSAISILAKHWNIKQKEIIAFGDDMNDIDLLEYSNIGIAMGNAIDDVKAAANEICDTNDNDGLAKWLEENVLL